MQDHWQLSRMLFPEALEPAVGNAGMTQTTPHQARSESGSQVFQVNAGDRSDTQLPHHQTQGQQPQLAQLPPHQFPQQQDQQYQQQQYAQQQQQQQQQQQPDRLIVEQLHETEPYHPAVNTAAFSIPPHVPSVHPLLGENEALTMHHHEQQQQQQQQQCTHHHNQQQSSPDYMQQHNPRKPRFSEVTLEQIRSIQQSFAAERDWDQFHTPRNLLLALTGEVGELAEIFQWRSDSATKRELPGFTPADKLSVGQELSDVLLYTIRMADVCGIDLGRAVLEKIALNSLKYPADRCRGSSAKYNSLPPAASSGTMQVTPAPVVAAGTVRTAGASMCNGVGMGPANGGPLFSGGSNGGFGSGASVFCGIGGNAGIPGVGVKKERGFGGGSGGFMGVSKARAVGVGMVCAMSSPGVTGGLEGTVGCMESSSGLSFDSSCEAMKRRRFTDEQVDALTKVAETVNWSLASLPNEERDRLCEELGLSKERMQNFFNNRKPRDLKRTRGHVGHNGGMMEDLEQADAAEQLQSLQGSYSNGPANAGANLSSHASLSPPQFHQDHDREHLVPRHSQQQQHVSNQQMAPPQQHIMYQQIHQQSQQQQQQLQPPVLHVPPQQQQQQQQAQLQPPVLHMPPQQHQLYQPIPQPPHRSQHHHHHHHHILASQPVIDHPDNVSPALPLQRMYHPQQQQQQALLQRLQPLHHQQANDGDQIQMQQHNI